MNDISSVSGDDSTATGSLVTMTTELPTGNLLAGMAGGRFDDVMWEAAGGEKKEIGALIFVKRLFYAGQLRKLLVKFKNLQNIFIKNTV